MVEGEANTSFFTWRQQGEMPSKGRKAPYKTIRSRENSLTITRTAWGNHPHDPITFLPQHMWITGSPLNTQRLQFEMRFGWGHRVKPYHSAPSPSQISCPSHISKPIMPSQQSSKVLTHSSINSKVQVQSLT